MEKGILLPSFYLAPIAYYSHILKCEGDILLETQEHFPKQTYRNRAAIHAANGLLNLTIPIKKSKDPMRSQLKDIQISYEEDWQRLHWMTLQSAYRRSAYFEFYEDDFVQFYQVRTASLLEFNQGLNALILRLLKLNKVLIETRSYQKEYENTLDLRTSIHPKKNQKPNAPYFQVFEPKNGFIPNVSIVDLLFNQGPSSKQYL